MPSEDKTSSFVFVENPSLPSASSSSWVLIGSDSEDFQSTASKARWNELRAAQESARANALPAVRFLHCSDAGSASSQAASTTNRIDSSFLNEHDAAMLRSVLLREIPSSSVVQ